MPINRKLSQRHMQRYKNRNRQQNDTVFNISVKAETETDQLTKEGKESKEIFLSTCLLCNVFLMCSWRASSLTWSETF